MTELNRKAYRELCFEHGGGAANIGTWLELWRVLHRRSDHGWRFEVQYQTPIWMFGLAGESHMTAKADQDWVTVFTYIEDDVEPFTSIADFESWLPEAERTCSGFSPTYLGLREHLEGKEVADAMLWGHDEQLRRQQLALGLEPSGREA